MRFAVGMLMSHFLDEDFDGAYPEMVASVHSEEYYVNMMRAWYFATALIVQRGARCQIEKRLCCKAQSAPHERGQVGDAPRVMGSDGHKIVFNIVQRVGYAVYQVVAVYFGQRNTSFHPG